MNYFDSSALVKRFLLEKGSPLVLRLWRQSQVATATVTYAEIHAVLARKRRERHLAESDYGLASLQFDKDWTGYVHVHLVPDVLRRARDLVRRQPLRGFDAIHLASALTLKTTAGENLIFLAADQVLVEAARAEGLEAVAVESG